MDNNAQERPLFDRMPLAAMHIRTALGSIYYATQRLAPPEKRDIDPELDKNAALLYQGYYRLLRLAKDLESLELLDRREPLPEENADLKVWLDEIVREATVPFELRGVTLEMVCAGDVNVEYDRLIDRQLERAAITSTSGFAKLYTDASRVLETE